MWTNYADLEPGHWNATPSGATPGVDEMLIPLATQHLLWRIVREHDDKRKALMFSASIYDRTPLPLGALECLGDWLDWIETGKVPPAHRLGRIRQLVASLDTIVREQREDDRKERNRIASRRAYAKRKARKAHAERVAQTTTHNASTLLASVARWRELTKAVLRGDLASSAQSVGSHESLGDDGSLDTTVTATFSGAAVFRIDRHTVMIRKGAAYWQGRPTDLNPTVIAELALT